MNKLEGGVMDIQKEKIKQEFWNWAKVENPRVVENAELGDVYATKILDHMFMGFAAAKAQAVPEGFVLVPKNPTHKMMEASWASLDAGSADEWWDVYEEVMKAAQEPAK